MDNKLIIVVIFIVLVSIYIVSLELTSQPFISHTFLLSTQYPGKSILKKQSQTSGVKKSVTFRQYADRRDISLSGNITDRVVTVNQ